MTCSLLALIAGCHAQPDATTAEPRQAACLTQLVDDRAAAIKRLGLLESTGQDVIAYRRADESACQRYVACLSPDRPLPAAALQDCLASP